MKKVKLVLLVVLTAFLVNICIASMSVHATDETVTTKSVRGDVDGNGIVNPRYVFQAIIQNLQGT